MNEKVHPAVDGYPYSLFQVCGIELEYMIVDSSTLDVKPLCDLLLAETAGEITNEVMPDGPSGIAAWSNELALHVLEFKTAEPVRSLKDVQGLFHGQVKRASSMLEKMGARLMPSAMHPWMVPDSEFRIWPHGSREIYNTFDSVFGCKGHGWSNLQSMHINLPFKDSDEFTALHNAIRLLIPVMNGLTASSPFAEGRHTCFHNYRMEVYRTNSALIPSITGLVVPDATEGIEHYSTTVLERIYSDLSPHDPEKIISHEWVNARGCIPRFDRGAIEIRTIDIQECPSADIACADLFISAIKHLVEGKFIPPVDIKNFSTEKLYRIFLDTIRNGSGSMITERDYTAIFGIAGSCTVCELWQAIAEKVMPRDSESIKALDHIFRYGSLSSRILKKTGPDPERGILAAVYRELCECLLTNSQYE